MSPKIPLLNLPRTRLVDHSRGVEAAAPESEMHANGATEWQRIAARRAMQNDSAGAIDAMENAVLVEPDSFHHWMWLGKMYRQTGDKPNAVRCARNGLRCLDEHPDPSISPEERTRLLIRSSLQAELRDRADLAFRHLTALRRTRLEAVRNASTFEEWRQADLVAAASFETLLELARLLGDRDEIELAASTYFQSLDHGLHLAWQEEIDPEQTHTLKKRREQIAGARSPLEL